jgi:GMP synthase (glutamine-hydrolysing)
MTHKIKPFLLLQSRPEDMASDNEYEGFLQATGLAPAQLERIRVESVPLPSLDLSTYSGIIVGGGPFNTSILHEAKSDLQKRVEGDFAGLLDEVVRNDFPFFGACYGVGTLGSHQGALINDTFAESDTPTTISLTAEGKKDPLLAGVPDTFQAIAVHKEACEQLPPHAVLLASSIPCPIQMFRIKSNLYATQFHPELDKHGLKVRVEIYKHAGYFAPEDGDALVAAAAAADLSYAPKVLQNFVQRYAQAA